MAANLPGERMIAMRDDSATSAAAPGREMAEDRFRAMAAAHGGDLASWPRGTRAPARALLRRRPELVAVLAAQVADG